MVGNDTSFVEMREGTTVMCASPVVKTDHIRELLLVSEAIKQIRLAELEMAKLTRQAIEALDRLARQRGGQPGSNREAGALDTVHRAGNQ